MAMKTLSLKYAHISRCYAKAYAGALRRAAITVGTLGEEYSAS
jgi:hypothetical protein